MDIAYVTMRFPNESETFAARDIRVIHEDDQNVDVFSILPSHSRDKELAREQNVDKIPRHYPSLICIIKSLFYFLFSTTIPSVICHIFKHESKNPFHLLKCIALILPSLCVSRKIIKKDLRIVHLFWGHYPSIVGYILSKQDRNFVISVFCGAYDLKYDLGITDWMLSNANCVFTHSKINISDLLKKGASENNINVVYRGLDLESFPPAVDRNQLLNRNKCIYTAGRLIKPKRFDLLIRIVRRLYSQDISVPLIISGGGPDRYRLQRLACKLDVERLVSFTGHISVAKVRQYMIKSKLFALLSEKKGERLPNVVKEAMVSGCICVVSKTSGISELVNHGVNGYITDTKKISETAELVKSLMFGGEYIDLRKKAARHIKSNFSVRKSKDVYLDIWQKSYKSVHNSFTD